MSAISDFNKVWGQKFPGSAVPPPKQWEDDVKSNLDKHKNRVKELKTELKQEEEYVKFLEALLDDVEKKKEPGSLESLQEPVAEEDYKEKEMEDEASIIEAKEVSPSLESINSVRTEETLPVESNPEEMSSSKESLPGSESVDTVEESPLKENGASGTPGEEKETLSEEDKDHFVTVIEVNGSDKSGSSSNQSGSDKRLKKVPPRPPPKHMRPRSAVDGSSTPTHLRTFSFEPTGEENSRKPKGGMSSFKPAVANAITTNNNSKSSNANGSSEVRPIVFDSKRGSENNGAGSMELESNRASLPPQAILKKFEGSRMPLPAPPLAKIGRKPPVDSERRVKGSKISDMVSKMESSNHSAKPSGGAELTPKRAIRKTPYAPPGLVTNSNDPALSDYVDPCDADFMAESEEVYNSLIPEQQKSSLDRHQKNSLGRRMNNSKSNCMENEDGEEPLYDAVAADPEEHEGEDDDYVTLDEGPNKTGSANNNTSSGNSGSENLSVNNAFIHNNLSGSGRTKKTSSLPTNKGLTKDGGMGISNSNNDVSTIKSQNSVISGLSIATTTSSGTASETEGLTGSPLPQDNSQYYANIDFFTKTRY